MKVTISKTHMVQKRDGSIGSQTTKLAGYDVPEGETTTIYIDGEPALVIEP